MLYLAALLILLVGLAHSYLGEKYILIRLFQRDNLPKILDSSQFTQHTLRFAWHITTLAWFGFSAILICIATDNLTTRFTGNIISVVFLMHFLVALVASKGKHLSWIMFLGIAIAVALAVNA